MQATQATGEAFTLDETTAVLERTPRALDALLRGISPGWQHANEGEGTWSPFEVVGHLVHTDETAFLPRARHILDHGESRPFEPLDRFAQLSRFPDWTLEALLDRFAAVRSENLVALRGWNLTSEQLQARGLHPQLGPVTLRQLLATWAAHDLSHLGQVVRVMAKRYAAEVGPWSVNLSILRR
ncbi:MAG TPA: DinB family protein [Deinococcales bacterium]|nr:DinB family protein [Deinococcales bacterium]